MSKVTADSSDEQASSRAWELTQEIATKLAQAKGICGLFGMISPAAIADQIPNAMSAAEDLIEGVQKAFDELRAIEDPS